MPGYHDDCVNATDDDDSLAGRGPGCCPASYRPGAIGRGPAGLPGPGLGVGQCAPYWSAWLSESADMAAVTVTVTVTVTQCVYDSGSLSGSLPST
jgi:hypothetical protein